MNAQDFHGVSIGGTVDAPTIVNNSDRPAIGYAVERITDSGYGPVVTVVDFPSLAVGNAIQPGKEQPLARFNVIRIASRGQTKSTTLGYELRAVLFADGTFYGPDSIFLDFSERISAVRRLALGVQHDPNKYRTLAKHLLSPLEILRRLRTATLDRRSLEPYSTVASTILDIRNRQGEQEAEASLQRLAALPEVRDSA
jgi:hypothetical protein